MSLLSVRNLMAVKSIASSPTVIMLFSCRSKNSVRLSPSICTFHKQIENRTHLSILKNRNGHFHPHPLVCIMNTDNVNSNSLHISSRKYICHNYYYRDTLGLIGHRHSSCYIQRRTYKSKKDDKTEVESSSDSESDSDYDDDDDDDNDDDNDDDDAPKTFKSMLLHVKSLRVDSIVSRAFDIARNRVDEIFFANQLRLNGKRFTKKSKQMLEGDFADIVTETREDVTKVKRVKLVKVTSQKTRSDKFIVKVKVWKAAFEVDNDGQTKR